VSSPGNTISSTAEQDSSDRLGGVLEDYYERLTEDPISAEHLRVGFMNGYDSRRYDLPYDSPSSDQELYGQELGRLAANIDLHPGETIRTQIQSKNIHLALVVARETDRTIEIVLDGASSEDHLDLRFIPAAGEAEVFV
jgi:hypothetical protein